MDKQSIYELQKVDCNCNDCKFMVRDLNRSPDKGKPCPVNFGTCNKFEKEVTFIPALCQLDTQDCFEHRRNSPIKDK